MYFSMLHPMLAHYNAHTIRRVHRSAVWYLHSHDLKLNKCVWTSHYNKAHRFESEGKANEFLTTYLGTRASECDVFTQDTLWMGL